MKVHASRRRKDPRNAAKVLLIMVRLRSKPCRGSFPERSSVMANPEQSFQQASVGSKTRSASIAPLHICCIFVTYDDAAHSQALRKPADSNLSTDLPTLSTDAA